MNAAALRLPTTGAARLEFVLTVVVVSVLATIVLDRIALLQAYAKQVVAATRSAQVRATSALSEARAATVPPSAASSPPETSSVRAPLAGAVP